MITFKKKPDDEGLIENILNPLVKKWFFSKFKSFSEPQKFAVSEIHSRKNTLVSAPTGGTKTLTAFLSIINELVDSAMTNSLQDKVYCVYISPLKALNYDIEVNLKGPLKEIEEIAGKKLNIRVMTRTGDTKQSEKAKMLRKPPHILITTPESLAVLLSSSRFRDLLRGVEWTIVDEIHALAENKRGVHLDLSLERLERLSPKYCRIGLSATVAPIEEVAKFLVGYEKEKLRDCLIINVDFSKNMDLKVLSPLPNLIDTDYKKIHDALYKLLDSLIQEHRTTLIFTNTRAGTERVIRQLKEKFPKHYSVIDEDNKSDEYEYPIIGAHHGSLSKSFRRKIEDKLRRGKLKAVVSSTSLELGIDIGFIDLVILLGSPKSVARALQRIGRSGHKIEATTKGRIVVLDRDDLVECSVLLKDCIEKKIDEIHIPKNALDVLSQHIAGIAAAEKINVKELWEMVKSSYCYHNLKRTDFNEVLEFLAGEYATLEDRHVYAKIWYDKDSGMIGRRGKLARMIYMTNIGTIPDEASVIVKVGNDVIGKIDESFAEKLKKGDIFALGGEVYKFKFSRGQVANVEPTVGKPTIPSWFSESLPLSFNLAMDISKFRRLIEEKFLYRKSRGEILNFIHDYLYVDDNSAKAIYSYFKEQYLFSKIPHDKRIIIEYIVEGEKFYAVFHTLYGRRVNDALSRAIALVISRTQHKDIEFGINDNGFYLASKEKIQAEKAVEIVRSDKLREILEVAIDHTEILNRRFRHCAARSLMILRQYKGRRKTVGKQQVSSMILMSAVRRISNNFPILKEARREVIEDLMDLKNAKLIIKGIEEREIKVETTNNSIISPFGIKILTQGYLDILKMEDKYNFLKRIHEQILVKISLKSNEEDMRDLIDFNDDEQ